MQGAIVTDARLVNASLQGANLAGADFSRSDLTNANLDGALTGGIRLDGAVLTNVELHNRIEATPAPRPDFIDPGKIASALRLDPAQPHVARHIDLTINFDFNSDRLTHDGMNQIQSIAAALNSGALQQAHILIEGHTDGVGTVGYNQDLSYRRALRVMRSLIDEYNIPAGRLSAQGFGKSRPIASNDNDLGRAMNRRVTLVNLPTTP